MTLYLLLTQLLAGLSVLCRDPVAQKQAAAVVVPTQALMLLLFWLVWGGYSIDAWRYLMGFWGSFLEFEKEWLFWSSGWLLSRLTTDPWPLKIMSATGAFVMCLAVIRFHREQDPWVRSLALCTVLLLPAFFLTFGNALRQGLGAAAILVGLLYLVRGKLLVFIGAAAVAFLFHQTTLALAAAVLAARFLPGLAVLALLLSPWASFVLEYVASWFGMSLAAYVRYWNYSEGTFHFAKFFLSYSLAWFLWFSTRDQSSDARLVATAYAFAVSISAFFLKFEVPFERFLLYSDFLIPFALPAVVSLWTARWDPLRYVSWILAMAAGLVLWRHPSIGAALGYV